MTQPAGSFNLEQYILHHLQNSHQWQLPFLPPVQLPGRITLHALMLFLSSMVLIFLFCVLYRKEQNVPSGITNMLETIVLFIRDEIAIANLGPEDGRKLTPLFCTFFFFILIMNLMGIIPLFVSATANINVTFALAFVTLGFMTIGAIRKNGLKGFLKSFVVSDIPFVFQCVIFVLEILGLFIKTATLTIRLFANILAGHMVILIFLGLVGLFGAIALPSVFLAVLIDLLEVFVSFLQAYVFTMLSALFIGHIYQPAH